MAELCSHAIACVITQSLLLISNTDDWRYEVAEAMELLKEVLAQIRINADFPEHRETAAFVYRLLVSIRGQLQEWPESQPLKYDGPWPKMPQPEDNPVWEVKHPNRKLGRALARFSLASIAKIERLLSGSPTVAISGAQKRKFAKALAPARGCVKTLAAPHKDEAQPDVVFAMADIKETLRYISASCPSFAEYLARHDQRKPFWIVLSHDETTGGNVLATEQRKKAVLVYMAFMDESMQALQDSQHAWIPIACVAHFQIANVNGSLGMIHRLIIEDWSRQNLSDQFPVGNVQVSLKLTMFIADMDGHRAALAAKGSAGLKPCAFCANCLSKDAQSTTERGQFFTIEEGRIDQFQATTQEGLQAYIRRLVPEMERMTKVDRDTLERCLGYNVTPHSMWTSDICCAVLPLECFINDQMHIYFSNGVCSLEINLWLAEIEKVTKKNVQDIQAAVLAADWKRPMMLHKKGENRYWIKTLFTAQYFKGNMYSGEAKRTRALMSLLGWLTESLWARVPELAEKAQCFLHWLPACNIFEDFLKLEIGRV
eukprot:Skav225984  [mRNA]  locus=scaffold5683:96988:98953:+ [translate_table: standard]